MLQDASIREGGDANPITALLIGSPTGQTLRLNTDHFIKRGLVEGLCPSCSAMALLTMQVNAPSGGRGHLTGIRGGGPLTTLILPASGDASLWATCWLNVLPADQMRRLTGNPAHDSPRATFPWLASGPGAGQTAARVTTPDDMSPLHVFWAMPRRLFLDFDGAQPGSCDLCSRQDRLGSASSCGPTA